MRAEKLTGGSWGGVGEKGGEAVNAEKGGEAVNADKAGEAVNAEKGGEAVNAEKAGEAVNAEKGGDAVNAEKGGEAVNAETVENQEVKCVGGDDDDDDDQDDDKDNTPSTKMLLLPGISKKEEAMSVSKEKVGESSLSSLLPPEHGEGNSANDELDEGHSGNSDKGSDGRSDEARDDRESGGIADTVGCVAVGGGAGIVITIDDDIHDDQKRQSGSCDYGGSTEMAIIINDKEGEIRGRGRGDGDSREQAADRYRSGTDGTVSSKCDRPRVWGGEEEEEKQKERKEEEEEEEESMMSYVRSLAEARADLETELELSVCKEVDMLEHLNESQKAAVKASLGQRLTIVQGPPGTG